MGYLMTAELRLFHKFLSGATSGGLFFSSPRTPEPQISLPPSPAECPARIYIYIKKGKIEMKPKTPAAAGDELCLDSGADAANCLK